MVTGVELLVLAIVFGITFGLSWALVRKNKGDND